jgi:hypothetical protein
MPTDKDRIKALKELETVRKWIRNPALIHCEEPTVLMRSVPLGYVNSNCTVCGNRGEFTEKAFHEAIDVHLECPICKRPMTKEKLKRPKVYYLVCNDCEISVGLVDIIPLGTELEKVVKGLVPVPT